MFKIGEKESLLLYLLTGTRILAFYVRDRFQPKTGSWTRFFVKSRIQIFEPYKGFCVLFSKIQIVLNISAGFLGYDPCVSLGTVY